MGERASGNGQRNRARANHSAVAAHQSSHCLEHAGAHFDGDFQIAELWYRFDPSGGLKVEFVAITPS